MKILFRRYSIYLWMDDLIEEHYLHNITIVISLGFKDKV